MNRPQMFTANNFKIDSARASDDPGRSERAKVFSKYVREAGIHDLKLFPSDDMEDLFLRVARPSQTLGGTAASPLNMLQVVNQVCLYQYKRACDDLVEDVVRTRLDGNTPDITFEGDLAMLNGVQAQNVGYNLETYKLVFKR